MTHIARSSLIIALFFAIDKVLGLVRQVLIARQFGLSYEIDVFNAANNIPDLLSALISGGALGVALIPVLSEYLEKRGRPAAWELFTHILNLAFLVTGGLAILIMLFARPLVGFVIAPGFPEVQKDLTVELMRLDLLAILIFSISGLVMSGLQANQHFLLPAMAPGLYNLGQIFGAGVLAPQEGFQLGPLSLPGFGLGVHGLVYGVILGAFLHLLIQVPGLMHYNFAWKPRLGLATPGVRQVLALLWPRVQTMFYIQIFFIARDNFASRLGEGAVTALNYGWFLMQVPETLIGTTLAIAILPTLSEYFSRGDRAAFHNTVNRALRVLLSLTIPITAVLIVGMEPLVRRIFGFDPIQTGMIMIATRFYLLGLVGHSLLELSSRSFYAQQEARIPRNVAALNAVMYLALAWSLSQVMGLAGIALATTISFSTEALILLYLLQRRFPGILQARYTLLRSLAGAGCGGLVTWAGITWLPLPELYSGLAAMAAGGLAFLPWIWAEVKILTHL
jgi:putative peptidoglycan lipid II flippase